MWILFYGSYIAKALWQKRKGISVTRMGRGEKPAITRVNEIFLAVITVGMALAQLLSLSFYGSWELLLAERGVMETMTAAAVIGTALSAAGCTLFLLSMLHMRDSWMAGIDESRRTPLVTDGVYAYSRNPAFVGFDLFYIGFSLLFSNALLLLFAFLGIFALHMQIRQEEAHMERTYGTAYREYRRRTGRYFGKKSRRP